MAVKHEVSARIVYLDLVDGAKASDATAKAEELLEPLKEMGWHVATINTTVAPPEYEELRKKAIEQLKKEGVI